MATPPQLTPEQRANALAKAAEARVARAELKNQLKMGSVTLAEALASTSSTVGKLKVVSLLESLPGVGKVKARKIIEDIGLLAPGQPFTDAQVEDYFGHFYEVVLEDAEWTMTQEYASPEVLTNKQVTDRSDQYSLAVTYHVLRTGRLPFPGVSTMAVLTALERHGGVLRRAARDLQLHPVTLSRRMKRLGIDSGID